MSLADKGLESKVHADAATTIESNGGEIVAIRVRFAGNVQGVGFRYRTRELALAFPVSGYVKNLPNGEVELTVEGCTTAVWALVAAVERRMRSNINQTTSEMIAVTGEFAGFEIRTT